MFNNIRNNEPYFLEMGHPLLQSHNFNNENNNSVVLFENEPISENNAINSRDLKSAKKEAFLMNFFFFLCSAVKIILTSLVFIKTNEKCYGPLFLWIILMYVHDILNFFTLLILNYEICVLNSSSYFNEVNNPWNLDDSYQNIDITLHSYLRQHIRNSRLNGFDVNNYLEKHRKCLGIFIELCRLFYFVLFVYGNVVFFSDNICSLEKTPYFWGLSLVFLFMGYIYLAIPLLIFSLFCFCLPFLLIFFICVNNRRRNLEEVRENFVKSLKTLVYRNIDEKGHECCICMVEYNEEDEIIVLPCNKKHSFHAECVRTWLKINGVCPICRKDFITEC